MFISVDRLAILCQTDLQVFSHPTRCRTRLLLPTWEVPGDKVRSCKHCDGRGVLGLRVGRSASRWNKARHESLQGTSLNRLATSAPSSKPPLPKSADQPLTQSARFHCCSCARCRYPDSPAHKVSWLSGPYTRRLLGWIPG